MQLPSSAGHLLGRTNRTGSSAPFLLCKTSICLLHSSPGAPRLRRCFAPTGAPPPPGRRGQRRTSAEQTVQPSGTLLHTAECCRIAVDHTKKMHSGNAKPHNFETIADANRPQSIASLQFTSELATQLRKKLRIILIEYLFSGGRHCSSHVFFRYSSSSFCPALHSSRSGQRFRPLSCSMRFSSFHDLHPYLKYQIFA